MPFIIGALIGMILMSLIGSIIVFGLKVIGYALVLACTALRYILPAVCNLLRSILRIIGNLMIRHYAYREQAYPIVNLK